jgi:hypothetical protein
MNVPLDEQAGDGEVLHAHAAAPGLPEQGFDPPGQAPLALVTSTHPRALTPQVTYDVADWQTLPDVAPMQAAGGAGQRQVALPALPPQTKPVMHGASADATKHRLASREQVNVALPEQNVPVVPMQPAGAGGQTQAADGNAPLQTRPAPHPRVDVTPTQPFASAVQVTSCPLVLHSFPAPPGQACGSAGQAHAAVPALPPQVCTPGHAVVPVTTRHWLASRPQVTTLFPWQKVPVLPLHTAGGAGHRHMLLGALPWQVRPAVQSTAPVTARQPLPSSAQVPTRVPLWQKPPAPAAHSVGAPVQEQVAVLPLAVQGLPAGQVVVCVIARQPSALSPQVTTEPLPAAQYVPAALQAAGGAGHVHAALGKLPAHGLPAVQVTDELS